MSLSREELMLVGGSDAAAIAGLHPNKKPIDVFARIRGGRVEDLSEIDPVWLGTELEPVVRKFAIRKYGWESLGPVKLAGTPRPFIRANLDDILRVHGEEMLGEYKTANVWTASRFGETETDEFPAEYHCQTQMYFQARPDLERGWLVAFLEGVELRRYPLRRDDDMGRALIEIIERFWMDHIETGVPPPLDNSDSTVRWLRERFPRHNGTLLPAPPEAARFAEAFRVARDARKLAEAQEKTARIELEKMIQDADGLLGDGWKVLFRANRDGLKTDYEALVRELNPPEELIQKYTRAVPGPRVFRPTFKES